MDGTDVLAVYDAVERASARARAGKGPSFLECVTLRMAGHSAHDAAEYVSAKLKQAWAKKDPIQRLEKILRTKKILTKQQIEEIGRRVREEVDVAIADAEARPLPRGEEALEGVYCEPECWWETGKNGRRLAAVAGVRRSWSAAAKLPPWNSSERR